MDMAAQRAALAALIAESGESYAALSRLIGRNAAYLQQFVTRGSPRQLAERDRALLARYLGVPEARLGGMRPLMQAQLNDRPRPLSEVNPTVPGPIAEAVMRYLRKRPHRRPDSAAPLRDAIAAHLGAFSDWRLTGPRWTLAQTINVTIPYGSSG